MAEIVNLNRYRKAKTKAEATARAAVNRARHGRPKADKDAQAREAARDSDELDGKRLDD